MSKVTYKSILKEAIAEFDTSKMADVKGPMLEPILSYTGDGNLETHKDAASVLERYYFQEKEPSSVNIPDTGEGVEIKQPPKDDLKDAPKVKDAIEDELEGKEGSLDKVTESDSVEERLLELEMSFLNEIEDDSSDADMLTEGATGPGGHVPDGTGPHGAGKGPGGGKADGSGKEAAEEGEEENKTEEKEAVKESDTVSMEDRLLQLEAEMDIDVADADKGEESESPAEEKLEKETEDVSESISDIESTVLEALFAEMEDANKSGLDASEEKEVKEEKPAGDADIEKKAEVKDVLDIDKAVAEGDGLGDGLGPIGVTDEDVDLNEMLSLLEAEIENADTDELDIPVEDIDKKSIRI